MGTVVLVGVLVVAAVGALLGASRLSDLQSDLDEANDGIDESQDESEELSDDLNDAQSEIESLRKRLQKLRKQQNVLAANDFGLPGLVFEMSGSWVCYQWPRCWDIEVDGTIKNNTNEGGEIECLVAMEYENGDVVRESVWSGYVPAREGTPVTFIHYQDNFGSDIEATYSEGCRWGDGPRDI